MQYVGQTGRALQKRFGEQYRRMKKPKLVDTFLYQHFNLTGHSPYEVLVHQWRNLNFMPKKDRLYLCGHFLDVTFVNQDRIQLLRNIEVRGKYKKYLTERYLDCIYVPVKPGSKSYIRFTMVDEALQKVDFTSNKFHIVLHFKRKELELI